MAELRRNRELLFIVQSLGHVQLFVTLWTAAHQASLSFTISSSLLKVIPAESVVPSNHLIPSFPLLILPSIVPSIEIFSNELTLCIRWPKYFFTDFELVLLTYSFPYLWVNSSCGTQFLGIFHENYIFSILRVILWVFLPLLLLPISPFCSHRILCLLHTLLSVSFIHLKNMY